MDDLFSRCRERAKLLFSSGESSVRGINVGVFPRHNLFRGRESGVSFLSVPGAGHGEWEAGCFRFRTGSDTFSLELVTEGEFLFGENERRFRGLPGTLFFVRRRTNGGMLCVSARARKRTVILDGRLLETLLARLDLADVVFMPLRDPEKIGRLFEIVETACAQNRSSDDIAGAAFQLLLGVARERNENSRREIPDVLQKILADADARIDENPRLAEYGIRFRLSASTLHRLFVRHCGAPFGQILLRHKMDAAAKLLGTTETPIKEIASALGFRDRFYFSAVFRKYFGTPPGAFRKKGDFRAEEL